MAILENKESWAKIFREGWLAKLQKTGNFYWKTYIFPENHTPVAGPGLDLKSSRLMLISSADPLGDYTVRTFPSSTHLENLAYAHDHYDHTAANDDPQVLLPLGHLREMATENRIRSLTSVVSFMGYQPDISRLLDETIPAILKIARSEHADAALLVPS